MPNTTRVGADTESPRPPYDPDYGGDFEHVIIGITVAGALLFAMLLSALSMTVAVIALRADPGFRAAFNENAGASGSDSLSADEETAVDEDSSAYDEMGIGEATQTPEADEQPSAEAPTEVAPPRVVKKTAKPNVAAPALDAFIARQYPGYRVEKRISFPSQWDKGRLGVNYLLVSERHPRFRLLVSVAALRNGEDPYESEYPLNVGTVLTNDEIFSKDAVAQWPILHDGGQDAMVAAIAKKLPTGNFVYAGSMYVPVRVEFSSDGGKGALERAMTDDGTYSRWNGEALLPSVAGREPVQVELDRDLATP